VASAQALIADIQKIEDRRLAPDARRRPRVTSDSHRATVNVTLNVDGSVSVSSGSGLTFAVSQPGVGVVCIEYN